MTPVPDPIALTTPDPRFDPREAVTVNGYAYVPAAQQIAWLPGEPPKIDGHVVYGHTWQPYRWKAYSPKSEQARRGIKGRWQAMNEYGGWDNAKAPDEWASEDEINRRSSNAA